MAMENHTKSMNIHGKNWWRGYMIGKGSFGSVYLAVHKNSDSQFSAHIAIKSAKLLSSETLWKERKILAKLRSCPHVIQCFGAELTTGNKGETVFNLLLEYASGGSLLDRMNKLDKLSESEIKRYTRSILQAINRVHELGYAHLDIKPANILLVPIKETDLFTVKLCDFGMAKRIGKKQSHKILCGTSRYLSPEAVLESVQDYPADIWAVGCIVLEMITRKCVWGRRPHWNTEKNIYMIGHELEIPEIPSEVSEEAKEFLKGCFVRNPDDRMSAEMLLRLPFVASVDGEDGGHDEYEVLDQSLIPLSSDDDDEKEEDPSEDTDVKEYWNYIEEKALLSCELNNNNDEKEEEDGVEEEEEPSVNNYGDDENPSSVCNYHNGDEHVLFVEDAPSICNYVGNEKAESSEEEEDPEYCYSEGDENEVIEHGYHDGDEHNSHYVDEDKHVLFVEDVPSIYMYTEIGEAESGEEEEVPEYCYSEGDNLKVIVKDYHDGDDHNIPYVDEDKHVPFVEDELSICEYVDNGEDESDEEEDPNYCYSEKDENELVQDYKRRKLE